MSDSDLSLTSSAARVSSDKVCVCTAASWQRPDQFLSIVSCELLQLVAAAIATLKVPLLLQEVTTYGDPIVNSLISLGMSDVLLLSCIDKLVLYSWALACRAAGRPRIRKPVVHTYQQWSKLLLWGLNNGYIGSCSKFEGPPGFIQGVLTIPRMNDVAKRL